MMAEKSPKRTRGSKFGRTVGFLFPKEIQELKREIEARWIEVFINRSILSKDFLLVTFSF